MSARRCIEALVCSLLEIDLRTAAVVPVLLEVGGVARQQHGASLWQLDEQRLMTRRMAHPESMANGHHGQLVVQRLHVDELRKHRIHARFEAGSLVALT